MNLFTLGSLMLLNDSINDLKRQYNDLERQYNHLKETPTYPKQHNFEEETAKIDQALKDLEEKDYFSEFYAIITKNKKLLDELSPKRVEEARKCLSMLDDDKSVKVAKERWKHAKKELRKFDPSEAKFYIDLYDKNEASNLASLYRIYFLED